MKLISQFKTTEAALSSTIDTSTFLKEYTLDCPRAFDRLFRTGVPATTLHRQANTPGSTDAVRVAETVQHFITLMDAVRLDQRAVDEIHPVSQPVRGSKGRTYEASTEGGGRCERVVPRRADCPYTHTSGPELISRCEQKGQRVCFEPLVALGLSHEGYACSFVHTCVLCSHVCLCVWRTLTPPSAHERPHGLSDSHSRPPRRL